MDFPSCRMKEQGYLPGSCLIKVNGKREPACQATLKYEDNEVYRRISSTMRTKEDEEALHEVGHKVVVQLFHGI